MQVESPDFQGPKSWQTWMCGSAWFAKGFAHFSAQIMRNKAVACLDGVARRERDSEDSLLSIAWHVRVRKDVRMEE
jgi:hypothetical protein